ncbi:tripartite motif-containing protein 66-like [Anabas testudineus]|uniref:tripartite motif-containing protein 66-like n=1 Tax=Anabas testudineus TaxID=64144 RepID=UPI000E458F02|nr:tripartite motif-containing protein 66-like [Anabas testudineus]
MSNRLGYKCAHPRSHPPEDTLTWLPETDILFFIAYIHTQRPNLLEMAELPHRCHGNFPQRRPTTLPQVAKCTAQLVSEDVSSETGPDPASTAEKPNLPTKHGGRRGFCEVEKESNQMCNGKLRAVSPSSPKRQRKPNKSVAALLKRIRIHPEAQRILGNSCIPVVSLERLNFQSVSLLSLQPVVSLVRLPCQKQAELHDEVFGLDRPRQNGLSQNEAVAFHEELSPSKPEESCEFSAAEPTPTSWTEPYCPDSSPSEEPEQDSGFDCESNPDQPFILFDSDEWDPNGKRECATLYLSPEPTLVIQLDPEPEADQDQSLHLEDESELKCEADVVELDDDEDQRPDLCCSVEEGDSSTEQQEPEPGAQTEEMESEDFCAVCLNGGDLLCCDRCPKVFHLDCHIPALIVFPLGDWVCTLCRSDQDPEEAYDCENTQSCAGVKAPYTLSMKDQRRCEKLALLLYCHPLSAPFHEPVSPLARNYYQIIKRPIDLSVIRRKLDKSNTLHYFTAEQFVDDILLMLKNCALFNYPDSEVAQAGRSLEVFFLSKLKEIFCDRTFPSASQDRTDRARLRWLSKKRKENCKKKKYVFSGKRYYL